MNLDEYDYITLRETERREGVSFGSVLLPGHWLCTKSHRPVRSGPLRRPGPALVRGLRAISCYFVDRVLRIRSHTIHEITLYQSGTQPQRLNASQ